MIACTHVGVCMCFVKTLKLNLKSVCSTRALDVGGVFAILWLNKYTHTYCLHLYK